MPARSRGAGQGAGKNASASDSHARLSSLEEQTAALLREARASVGRTRARAVKTRKRRRTASSRHIVEEAAATAESNAGIDKNHGVNHGVSTTAAKMLDVGDKPGSADPRSTASSPPLTEPSDLPSPRPMTESAAENIVDDEGINDLAARTQGAREAPANESANDIAIEIDAEAHADLEDADLASRELLTNEVKLADIIAAETKHVKTDFLQLDKAFWPEDAYTGAADSSSPVGLSPSPKKSAATPKRRRVRRKRRTRAHEAADSEDDGALVSTAQNDDSDARHHYPALREEGTPHLLADEAEVEETKEVLLADDDADQEIHDAPVSTSVASTQEAKEGDADPVNGNEGREAQTVVPSTRRPSMIVAKAQEQSLRDLGFAQEAQRVSLKIDDFVPGTNVSVADYDAQKELVKNVEAAEAKRKGDEAAALERKLEHHRRALENHAATLMQSCVRGRLGRKRALQVRAQGDLTNDPDTMSDRHNDHELERQKEEPKDASSLAPPVPVEAEDLDENWTRVHDPVTGDTWYFNEATGESQWELPDLLGKARKAADEPSVRVGKDHAASSTHFSSIMEEPDIVRIFSPKGHSRAPLLSHSAEAGAFDNSDAVDALDASETRPAGGMQDADDQEDQEEDDLDYLTQPAPPRTRDAADASEGAGTGELFDKAEEIESEDEASAKDAPAGQDLDNGLEGLPSTAFTSLESRQSDAVSEAGSEFSQSTGLWSQSCETPRFFLPDGSTDVKLRETVRHALKQTKFDSVSTLLSSMAKEAKSLRKRAGRKSKRDGTGFDMKAVVQCANLSRQEPQMVAGLKIKPRGTRGKRVRKQGRERRGLSKDQRDEDTTADPDEDTPAIYNVTYPGMRRQDLQGVDEVDEDEHEADNGEEGPNNQGPHKEICFLCWSAGDDMVKRCDEHQKVKESKSAEGSVLTCANWNLAALQRKYRAEEIQELFAKANACLRWDLNRKRFITVIQAKHPVYRATFDLLAAFNRRVRSLNKVRKWLKSVLDQLQLGKIKGDSAARKCSILRAKETLMNNRWIRKFKETVILVEPQPPVTEDDIVLRGELDLEKGYKVMVRAMKSDEPSRAFRFVMAPTAAPFALYRPRVIDDIQPPRFVRVPAPSYIFTPDADRELVRRFTTQASKRQVVDENANQLRGTAVNVYMDMQMEGSWIERLASHAARTATEKAIKEIRDQIPQIVRLRTKHPPPTSIKYATFARRDFDKEGIKRLGGYPPMMAILSQEVTTAVCAQYGKYVVTSKTSIAPIKKKYLAFEDADGVLDPSLTFKSFAPPDTASLGRSYAPLVSVLNTRLPPCIVASAAQHEMLSLEREAEKEAVAEDLRQKLASGEVTKRVHDAQWQRYLSGEYARRLDDHRVQHANGENREVQTGETLDVGFRTTAVAPSQPVETLVDTTEFVPSADIAVPNTPGIRGAVTTQAGPDYPFCIPSTRELTLLDHFHLLAFAEASSNSTCCFTTLGRQDPGLYMIRANFGESLGVLEMRVYRSFAYFQMPHIEEFTTAEGVPYWYNRKTGETFWESPLLDLDSVVDNEEDRPLVEALYKATTTSERKKFSDTLGGKRKPPSQMRMRQHMLKDYESLNAEDADAAKDDSLEPEFARELARADEKRRALDKRFRDRVGQTSVLKGTAPLLSVEEERAQAKRQRREHKKKLKKQKKKEKKLQRQQQEQLEGGLALGSGDESELEEQQPLRTRDRGSEPATAPPPPKKRSSLPSDAALFHQEDADDEEDHNDHEHSALLSTIQTALQTVMASQQAESKDMSSDDFLKLGMGLGLGIGLGKKKQKLQKQQKPVAAQDEDAFPSAPSAEDAASRNPVFGFARGPGAESDAGEEDLETASEFASSPDARRGSKTATAGFGHGYAADDDEDGDSEHEDEQAQLLVPTPRHQGPYSKPRVKPTPTPDEQEMLHTSMGDENAEAEGDSGDSDSDDDLSVSDSSSDASKEDLDKNFDTHEPAGEGRYWTATGTAVAKSRGQVMHSSTALPEGFVNSVYKPHTAKQHADYLPSLPNLNEARSVGVVKPRNIIKDWNHSGFDPWSDGKDKYTTSFVPSLFVDDKGEDQSGGLFGDKAGLAERRAEVADQQRLAEDLDKLFSWCRHGKYEDIDEYFKDPDCTFPIDSKDSLGNTLLSISAQNGNKRIAKLCLRRGADINTQNLNGQTVLHYCMAYGFEPLAEYFMGKGADDSLVNADGLTCYEGLSLEDVQNL